MEGGIAERTREVPHAIRRVSPSGADWMRHQRALAQVGSRFQDAPWLAHETIHTLGRRGNLGSPGEGVSAWFFHFTCRLELRRSCFPKYELAELCKRRATGRLSPPKTALPGEHWQGGHTCQRGSLSSYNILFIASCFSKGCFCRSC